jgi:hypothetical protein
MSAETLLVTQLQRDADEAPWYATTETLAAEIEPPCIDTFNKRVVIEAVTYSEAQERPFTDWLCKQADRDDPVGDLASDYIVDCRLRKIESMTPEELKLHVQLVGCAEAKEALEEASKEYAATAKDKMT